MLRTNAKKAIENIKNYIEAGFCFDNYDDGQTPEPQTQKEKFLFVLATFRDETKGDKFYKTEFDRFRYWAGGLPSVIDTNYYYNRSAVADLGDILEETDEERNRYTEAEAEEMLTRLIYRELRKAEQ